VQDRNDEYGKYEPGNKISFKDFKKYLMNVKGKNFDFDLVPKIKEAIQDTFDAFWLKFKSIASAPGATTKPTNQFELLGYDFMIDDDCKVYLIEVNTNPCLDISPCSLLKRLIPTVLD
jgi:hypothetical protein